MKRLINTILALLITVASYAQVDDLLQKGNDAYIKGNYKAAIEDYNQILKTNLESPEVYYNLGNAYYKSGQYTLAILNYERAKVLKPDDADINFNLELANQHVVDSIKELPTLFFVRWWNSLISSRTTNTWAVYSIIAFILFLSMMGFYFFSHTGEIRRLTFWTGILLIIISIFTWSFAAKQKNRLINHNYAIVMQPTVTVKSSPSEQGTNLFVIHEGLKVKITDKLSDWVEITLPDGNKGWLPSDMIERI